MSNLLSDECCTFSPSGRRIGFLVPSSPIPEWVKTSGPGIRADSGQGQAGSSSPYPHGRRQYDQHANDGEASPDSEPIPVTFDECAPDNSPPPAMASVRAPATVTSIARPSAEPTY